MEIKIQPNGKGSPICGIGGAFTVNGIPIGNMLRNVDVSIPVDDVVMATCEVYISDLDISGAVLRINGVEAPEELRKALSEYFVGNEDLEEIATLQRVANEDYAEIEQLKQRVESLESNIRLQITLQPKNTLDCLVQALSATKGGG